MLSCVWAVSSWQWKPGGMYSHIPYRERVCQLCSRGEVEEQSHFIAIWPAFNDLRYYV